MPNNKEQTYVIKFKAQAEGLDKIIQDISKIAQGGDIKLTDKMQADIAKVQQQTKTLLQTLSSESDKAAPNPETLKEAYALFKQIADVAQKIGFNMSAMVVPKELQTQLEKANQELVEQEEHLAKLQEQLRKNQDIVGPKGGATVKARATAFEQTGGKTLDTGSDAIFSNVGDVKDRIQSLKVANKQEGLDPAVYEQNARAIQELEKFVEEYNRALSKLTTTAQANVNAIKQAIVQEKARIQTTQDNIAAIETEISTTQNITQATNEEKNVATQITAALSNLTDIRNQQADALEQEKNAQAESKRAAAEAEEQQKRVQKSVENAKSSIDSQNKSLNTNATTFGRAAKQVFTYGSALSILKRIYSETIRTITDMDKALTDMAVVTSMSREQTWELVGQFQDLADATGKTTTEIANMATKFYQQGKATTQVIQLTEAAAKAATIAGIDGSRSVDLLTNAMNGFQMSASSAMEVSDKFASLAAASATDYEELAVALSKVAAQANLAGMSMDFTLGMLAKGIEVTREAPETIGTALKTVISRMRELTDYGSTLEDNVDVNRVEKALGNIGVALRDEQGQFRDLEDVLTEVGLKWETLNKNQQANVAVALAGTRQQSRLIAMMQDFDRTLELVDVSANSYGATMAQSAEYMEGLGAKMTLLTNAWQQLITTISDSELIIGAVELITKIVNTIDYIFNNTGALVGVLAILASSIILIVSTKIQEAKIQAETNTLQREQAQIEREKQIQDLQGIINKRKQEAIAAKEKEIADKKAEKARKKESRDQVKITAEKKKQAVWADETLKQAEKEQRVAQIDKETKQEVGEISRDMTALNKEIKADEIELSNLKAQDFATEEERLQLQTLQLEKQKESSSLWLAQTGWLGGIISQLTIMQGIFSVIQAGQAVWNALVAVRAKLHKKAAKEAAKEAAAETTGAVASAAGNAAKNIPIAGIGIALVLLAAIGLALGITAAQANKTGSALDKTAESLNELQAELYNTNQSITTVNKLGDEFDSLSSKIVKTTDDLTRMNEIAQEVNDTLGYSAVDLNTDAATQSLQIKGALRRLEEDRAAKVQESEITLAKGFLERFGWRKEDIYSLPVNDETNKYFDTKKKEYIASLGESGRNTLRNIAINQIEGLAEQNAKTQEIIQDMFLEMAPEMITNQGTFDINKFLESDVIKGASGTGTIASFMAELEKVTQDGSLSAYESWLSGLTEKQREIVTSSNEYLASVQKLHDLGAIKTFENMDLTNDELGSVVSVVNKLNRTLEKNGVEGTDVYANMAKNGSMSMEEMYAQISANGDAWLEHVKALDGDYTKEAEYTALETERAIAEASIADIEAKKDKHGEYTEEQAQELNELKGIIAEIDEEEKKWTNADEYVNKLKTQAQSVLLVDNATSHYTEQLTKLGSTLDRLGKINNLSSMSLADQMELLNDYPELIDAMRNGNLDAATSLKILGEQYDKIKNELKEDIGDKAVKWADEKGKDILERAELTDIFDEENKETLYKTAALGQDSFAATMKSRGLTEEEITKLWGDISDAAAKNYQVDKLEEGGVASLIETDFNADEKTNQYNRTKAYYEQLNEELDDLTAGTEEYNTKLKEREKAIQDHIKSIQSQVDDENETQIKKFFGDIKGYDDIRKAFEIINGQIIINAEAYEKLDDKQKAALEMQYGNLIDYAEKQKDLADEEMDLYKEIAQSYVDAETQKRDAQIESLKARKEALEKYFEEVDALDEEEDRATQHDSLVTQIAALTGALDGSSKSKIKELQSELRQLQEEELQAQKESQRDAILNAIDTQIENLNTEIDNLSASINNLVEWLSDHGTLDSYSATINAEDITGPNAKGGLVDYTGLAWVDGTPTQPEAFLSATDVRLIQDLVSFLKLSPVETSNDNNVTIEKIEIKTDHLDNNQDFSDAGRVLGEAFSNAIRARGTSTNARK